MVCIAIKRIWRIMNRCRSNANVKRITSVRFFLFAFLLVVSFSSCSKKKTQRIYLAESVVVLVVDGPRYSETWGDPLKENIPHMAHDLAPEGVVFTNFRNNGPTYTSAGHTAILTGNYQEIDNGGGERPLFPNYLNYWLKATKASPTKSWFFTSKDKLEILSDSQDAAWMGNYVPNRDCGINGLGSGYRPDSITVQHILDTLDTYHPNLVFINFREPDYSGHSGNWEDYLDAIRDVDEAYFTIWNYLQASSFYKNKTAFFITNDHGRHLDEFGGFSGHGDDCEGCRHINLFAAGPDFKKAEICNLPFEQIDITATIAEMLHLDMIHSNGKVIHPLFRN